MFILNSGAIRSYLFVNSSFPQPCPCGVFSIRIV
ncbi:hypothetical protein VPHK435_0092 [Vibrio phage K435]